VDNGAKRDAVARHVRDSRTTVSVYVTKGSSTTVNQINDGSYKRFEAPAQFTITSVAY